MTKASFHEYAWGWGDNSTSNKIMCYNDVLLGCVTLGVYMGYLTMVSYMPLSQSQCWKSYKSHTITGIQCLTYSQNVQHIIYKW